MSLKHIFRRLKPIGTSRHFSISGLNSGAAYDGDGKTTVTILNKQSGMGVMIDSYSQLGFRLNNGMFVVGPMVLFPRTAISWNVTGDQDITKESLALFTLIEPKLDLLVVGYGKTGLSTKKKIDSEILALKISRHINMEVLPVERAAATFNYLCSEGRWVAGAFIPPALLKMTEDEYLNQRKNLTLPDD